MKSILVRAVSCFSPRNIIQEEEPSVVKFGKLVDKLFEHGRLQSQQADRAKSGSEEFINSDVKENKDKFSQYDVNKERIDKFLGIFPRVFS